MLAPRTPRCVPETRAVRRRPDNSGGGDGGGSAAAQKMLLDKKWWRSVLLLGAVCALCIGSIWDRTCNTDPNSVDACASWRLGTIDMLYQNRAHARLSTGEQSHFAATGMKKLIQEEFCLPRDVKQSFASHRPAKGERYPISRLKPYTFGTDPQQTEQLRTSAAAFGVDLVVEGHGLKWTGLQMKLIAFRDYIVSKTSPGGYICPSSTALREMISLTTSSGQRAASVCVLPLVDQKVRSLIMSTHCRGVSVSVVCR
jgi:hypothetical protein